MTALGIRRVTFVTPNQRQEALARQFRAPVVRPSKRSSSADAPATAGAASAAVAPYAVATPVSMGTPVQTPKLGPQAAGLLGATGGLTPINTHLQGELGRGLAWWVGLRFACVIAPGWCS